MNIPTKSVSRLGGFLTLAVIALALLPWHPAHATDQNQSITLTPTTAKPEIDPGGSYQSNFRIINQGTGSYDFSIYTAGYSVNNLDYTPDFKTLPGHTDVRNWIKVDRTSASLAPAGTIDVNYQITVPTDAQPGGYYAVIFSETKVPQAQQGVTINQRVGEVIYITVNGPVKHAGAIKNWDVPFLQGTPLSATVDLENTGGIHYFSDVNVKVTDIFGNVKYNLTTQKAVLPQTLRRIVSSWPGTPAIGLYKVTGSASVFGKATPLAEHWVLVISEPIRVGTLVVLGILLIAGLARLWQTRKSKASHHVRSHKK